MECWPDDEMFTGNVEAKVGKPEGANLIEIALIPSVDVCGPELSHAFFAGRVKYSERPSGDGTTLPPLVTVWQTPEVLSHDTTFQVLRSASLTCSVPKIVFPSGDHRGLIKARPRIVSRPLELSNDRHTRSPPREDHQEQQALLLLESTASGWL